MSLFQAPENFILYSQRTSIIRLIPDTTSDCPESILPLPGLRNVKSLDFDPNQNFVYWIDGNKVPTIKRANSNGNHVSVVVPTGTTVLTPFDLAVDPIGRLLFWSCATHNAINVTRLDNSLPFGVVVQKNGEKPRLLAIHAKKRLLFYTDVGAKQQLIKSRLDGTHRFVITQSSNITALAVDCENDLIVWSNGQSISISNIDGENQHVLLNEDHSRITQLVVHAGWLYWIDREHSQLQRIELITGKSRAALSAVHVGGIADMISVRRPSDHSHHVCSPLLAYGQRRCSHLCILNGTGAMCACPTGTVLQPDRRTCTAPVECGPEEFTCVDDFKCISQSWRCDHQKDCTDGSDEVDCAAAAAGGGGRHCQFRCTDDSHQCVDARHLCDGVAHCADKSDEVQCCREGLLCPNTQLCLPQSLVCDKIEHCTDGYDEHPSVCAPATVDSDVQLRNSGPPDGHNGTTSSVVLIIVGVFSMFVSCVLICYCLLKRWNAHSVSGENCTDAAMMAAASASAANHNDGDEDWVPMQPNQMHRGGDGDGGVILRKSTYANGSSGYSYDRNNITGTSSGTTTNDGGSSSVMCYPRETLNPPPSPVTTRTSSPSTTATTRYGSYRYYRSVRHPNPPPTQCSTDVYDDSDYAYYVEKRSRCECEPSPPPPTPRSHCHSDSIPTSPSSRSSTYLSPLPPPPSPVLN